MRSCNATTEELELNDLLFSGLDFGTSILGLSFHWKAVDIIIKIKFSGKKDNISDGQYPLKLFYLIKLCSSQPQTISRFIF